MIVEDDPNDQFLLLHAFRAIGVNHPIHVVSTGLEGLAYFRGEGRYAERNIYGYPAFVTTDLKMPRGDGFMVLDFLNTNRHQAKVLVAVLSASSDEDDVRKSYALGATSYHIKPINNAALENQLRAIYSFWMACELPEADVYGVPAETSSSRKLGERFECSVQGQKFPEKLKYSATNLENPS